MTEEERERFDALIKKLEAIEDQMYDWMAEGVQVGNSRALCDARFMCRSARLILSERMT